MKRNELIALSMEYASYLMRKAIDVESIIIFGSVARGDFDKESDIDIFVNIRNSRKVDKDIIRKATNEFYGTKAFEKWKMLGIKNYFSVIVGNIDSNEWADLRRSIMTDGIVLYGKYLASPKKMRHYVLISYESVKNDKKRVNLHRKLFGYVLNGKRYPGIVEKENGIRIYNNSFLIKIESYKKIKDIFNEMKISPKIIEVWKD